MGCKGVAAPALRRNGLRDVFLADCVVVSLGVCLYLEMGEVLFGSSLKVVVLVNNGDCWITAGGWSKEEPQLVGLHHEALYRLCHNSHPLSLARVKQ